MSSTPHSGSFGGGVVVEDGSSFQTEPEMMRCRSNDSIPVQYCGHETASIMVMNVEQNTTATAEVRHNARYNGPLTDISSLWRIRHVSPFQMIVRHAK